jgi:hypothetical protein
MRELIKVAAEAIYSEQFDFDLCVRDLSSGDDRYSLLPAYVAIHTAAKLTEPLSNDVLNEAVEQLRASELNEGESEFDTILGLHKDLAEISWLERTKTILEGKLASKANEYSYDATVYRAERAKKGPLSREEREKFRKLTGELSQAEERLEAYLDEQESIHAAEEAFRRMKEGVDIEARTKGPRSKEELEEEFRDLVEQLRDISRKTDR